jgi:2-iminobutanoate/2-iminopropanoate deaminase
VARARSKAKSAKSAKSAKRKKTATAKTRSTASRRRKTMQPDALVIATRDQRVLYSNVVIASSGRLVFIAGQLARDRNGNIVGAGDMRTQIRQVCENIKAAVEAAGGTLRDLVKTNTFTTDIVEFRKNWDVRTDYFGADPPTSTTVEVRQLAFPECLVEIDAIAIIP